MPLLRISVTSVCGVLPMLMIGLLAVLEQDTARRRRVLAGGAVLALGLASLSLMAPALKAAPLSGSAVIGFAIAWLGAGIAGVVTGLGLRDRLPTPAGLLGGAAVAVLALSLPCAAGIELGSGAGLRALAIAGAGGLALFLLRFLWLPLRSAIMSRWLARMPRSSPPPTGVTRETRSLLLLQTAGAVVALVSPQLDLCLAGAVVAILAGALAERRAGMTRWPLLLAACGVALGLAWFLLDRVAAGEPRLLSLLPDAPYSSAFELLVAALLLGTAIILMGAWPFQSARRGPWSPIVGATLVVRVVAPVLPVGLVHWQPLAYPFVALTAWYAALALRPEAAFTAWGALGVLSGDPLGGWIGTTLLGAGALTRVSLTAPGPGPGRWAGFCRAFLVVGCVLAVPLLTAALSAQVVYSVVAVAGIVVALARRDLDR
ncbi:MAG TPA: hypothetical protein VMG41_00260 [Gemmatimonadales bacterium]|nr:hypothetical protein [Gemmatimonadales bacterium]